MTEAPVTPTTLAEALHITRWPGIPHDRDNGPCNAHAAALLSLPPNRRAALAAELLDAETLAPHPNEQHEFRTTCLRCGERGTLHISLIGPDEVVTIAPALRSPT